MLSASGIMNTCTCTNPDWVVSFFLSQGDDFCVLLFGVCHGHIGPDRDVLFKGALAGSVSSWSSCTFVRRTLGAWVSLRERLGQTLLVLRPTVH